MLQEILWLDSGDTIIIRGTGTQIQYNCVTRVDLLHHHGEFDSLVLELQQLFSVSQWVLAAA